MIRLTKRVFVPDLGRVLVPDTYELNDYLESVLVDRKYAVKVSASLSDSDDEIKAYLEQLNAKQINRFWADSGYDALADFLVERAGRERSENWKLQQMGNMIEKHLGL